MLLPTGGVASYQTAALGNIMVGSVVDILLFLSMLPPLPLLPLSLSQIMCLEDFSRFNQFHDQPLLRGPSRKALFLIQDPPPPYWLQSHKPQVGMAESEIYFFRSSHAVVCRVPLPLCGLNWSHLSAPPGRSQIAKVQAHPNLITLVPLKKGRLPPLEKSSPPL